MAAGDVFFVAVPGKDTAEGPLEEALELKYKDEETKQRIAAAEVCPVKGELVYNDQSQQWDLVVHKDDE